MTNLSDFTLYEYQAVLIYAVDGDTVDMEVDLGFSVTLKDRFRLLGINSPERNQDGFNAAKEHMAGVVSTAPNVFIRTHKDKHDKYGRMLAEIWYQDKDGLVNLNQEMLSLGLAVPMAE